MVSMVIYANLYNDCYVVSGNICIFYAYSAYCYSSTYIDFGISCNFTNGMDCTVLWNHFQSLIANSLVTLSLYSMFKMGKLTQSQKALFLWKNPIVKTQ